MKRYELLQELAKLVTDQDLVVTSIGGVKPEWYSLMPGNGTMFADLLGCATPFSLGVALNLPHRRIIALDTDGGVLFNLGALCTVGKDRRRILRSLFLTTNVTKELWELRQRTPPAAASISSESPRRPDPLHRDSGKRQRFSLVREHDGFR